MAVSTRKFPRNLQFTAGPVPGSPSEYYFSVQSRTSPFEYYATGVASSHAEAREAAWLQLEEAGLVMDE